MARRGITDTNDALRLLQDGLDGHFCFHIRDGALWCYFDKGVKLPSPISAACDVIVEVAADGRSRVIARPTGDGPTENERAFIEEHQSCIRGRKTA